MWKRRFLSIYYHGSYPYRWCWNRLAEARGRAPVMVLFYHRVADDGAGPWTCSNRMFAKQIWWLKSRYDLVSLAEAQRRIQSGNRRACVSITFDDGYADNCREALPLLVREQIPCTYFVTTRHVFEGTPFPHDAARGQAHAPNTLAELKSLVADGIEIGAHTRTHADLGRISDPRRLYDEVVSAGQELANALGRPIRYFAFPFGQFAHLNPAAFELAREAGYVGVCSAYGGLNFPGDDTFHLQRIHGDEDLLRMKNWLTVDPRKRRVPRYEYQRPGTQPLPVGVAVR